ncbi:MAG: leucine-rich repeat protein [Clostridium sp.]|nr:leucine-rich repeat protein [Clostridium sp.]
MPTTVDGYEYSIVGGNVWITGYIGLGGNITIPNTIDWYPVTRIGYASFENNNNITQVFIPSGINDIGKYAFNNCSSLLAINVDSSNSNYFSSFGVLYNKSQTELICNPAGLTGSFTIPQTVISISDWAFAYSHLTNISIQNSVNSIGIYAFRNCINLRYVNIPSTVTNIGFGAFNYCSSLASITVDFGNINYSSLNDVLYNKQQTELICYPAGKLGPFTIPNSVTLINSSAFESCIGLTSIIIGSNVNTIADKAFSSCTNLISITMGSSVIIINSDAFSYCTNLESVTIGSSVNKIDQYGFYSCIKLSSAKFLGNAPRAMGEEVFGNADPDFKIYYIYGNSGFTNPWNGYQTEALYTVTYDGNENTSGTVPIDNKTYHSNQTIIVSANTGALEKLGHNFEGWNTRADGNGIHYEPGATFLIENENVILYAQWPPYTVTYNGNGNISGTVPVDSKEYDGGENVTVLNNSGFLKKSGYKFGGWNTRADGNGTHYDPLTTFVMGKQNVILYAEWVQVYTVTYDGNGNMSGTVPVDRNEYEGGENVTVLNNTGSLKKSGYKFGGWNTRADGNGTHCDPLTTFVMGKQNVILYAEWVQVYTVTYDGNGNTSGTAPFDSNEYVSGANVPVLKNTGSLRKENYAFVGWNTEVYGNGINYEPGTTLIMGNQNIILYAQWKFEQLIIWGSITTTIVT